MAQKKNFMSDMTNAVKSGNNSNLQKAVENMAEKFDMSPAATAAAYTRMLNVKNTYESTTIMSELDIFQAFSDAITPSTDVAAQTGGKPAASSVFERPKGSGRGNAEQLFFKVRAAGKPEFSLEVPNGALGGEGSPVATGLLEIQVALGSPEMVDLNEFATNPRKAEEVLTKDGGGGYAELEKLLQSANNAAAKVKNLKEKVDRVKSKIDEVLDAQVEGSGIELNTKRAQIESAKKFVTDMDTLIKSYQDAIAKVENIGRGLSQQQVYKDGNEVKIVSKSVVDISIPFLRTTSGGIELGTLNSTTEYNDIRRELQNDNPDVAKKRFEQNKPILSLLFGMGPTQAFGSFFNASGNGLSTTHIDRLSKSDKLQKKFFGKNGSEKALKDLLTAVSNKYKVDPGPYDPANPGDGKADRTLDANGFSGEGSNTINRSMNKFQRETAELFKEVLGEGEDAAGDGGSEKEKKNKIARDTLEGNNPANRQLLDSIDGALETLAPGSKISNANTAFEKGFGEYATQNAKRRETLPTPPVNTSASRVKKFLSRLGMGFKFTTTPGEQPSVIGGGIFGNIQIKDGAIDTPQSTKFEIPLSKDGVPEPFYMPAPLGPILQKVLKPGEFELSKDYDEYNKQIENVVKSAGMADALSKAARVVVNKADIANQITDKYTNKDGTFKTDAEIKAERFTAVANAQTKAYTEALSAGKTEAEAIEARSRVPEASDAGISGFGDFRKLYEKARDDEMAAEAAAENSATEDAAARAAAEINVANARAAKNEILALFNQVIGTNNGVSTNTSMDNIDGIPNFSADYGISLNTNNPPPYVDIYLKKDALFDVDTSIPQNPNPNSREANRVAEAAEAAAAGLAGPDAARAIGGMQRGEEYHQDDRKKAAQTSNKSIFGMPTRATVAKTAGKALALTVAGAAGLAVALPVAAAGVAYYGTSFGAKKVGLGGKDVSVEEYNKERLQADNDEGKRLREQLDTEGALRASTSAFPADQITTKTASAAASSLYNDLLDASLISKEGGWGIMSKGIKRKAPLGRGSDEMVASTKKLMKESLQMPNGEEITLEKAFDKLEKIKDKADVSEEDVDFLKSIENKIRPNGEPTLDYINSQKAGQRRRLIDPDYTAQRKYQSNRRRNFVAGIGAFAGFAAAVVKISLLQEESDRRSGCFLIPKKTYIKTDEDGNYVIQKVPWLTCKKGAYTDSNIGTTLGDIPGSVGDTSSGVIDITDFKDNKREVFSDYITPSTTNFKYTADSIGFWGDKVNWQLKDNVNKGSCNNKKIISPSSSRKDYYNCLATTFGDSLQAQDQNNDVFESLLLLQGMELCVVEKNGTCAEKLTFSGDSFCGDDDNDSYSRLCANIYNSPTHGNTSNPFLMDKFNFIGQDVSITDVLSEEIDDACGSITDIVDKTLGAAPGVGGGASLAARAACTGLHLAKCFLYGPSELLKCAKAGCIYVSYIAAFLIGCVVMWGVFKKTIGWKRGPISFVIGVGTMVGLKYFIEFLGDKTNCMVAGSLAGGCLLLYLFVKFGISYARRRVAPLPPSLEQGMVDTPQAQSVLPRIRAPLTRLGGQRKLNVGDE